MHLHTDGRLDIDQLFHLQEHLAWCSACRSEQGFLETLRDSLTAGASVAEPEHLTRRILARVAIYEARRAALPRRIAVYVRDASWRIGLTVAIVVLAMDLTQPALWASLTATANHEGQSLVQVLIAPGPNSVAWGFWALGVAVMVALTVCVARSESYAAWVRSLAERLPQLW